MAPPPRLVGDEERRPARPQERPRLLQLRLTRRVGALGLGHRHAEPLGDARHEGALDDDRERARRRRRSRRSARDPRVCATTASEASRIGTAPLRPAQVTKSRSPRRSRDGQEQRRDDERPHDEAEDDARARGPPTRRRARQDVAEVDRQPERDEDGELAEARRARDWKRSHLALVGSSRVADHDPGDEDGEEARAVRDGGDAVDEPRAASMPRAGTARASGSGTRRSGCSSTKPRDGARPRARRPSRAANSQATSTTPASACVGELDHPDHQRDPDGVVEPRLALEDRAGAALDLLAGEDGERHRRVGRRERRADQERRRVQSKPSSVVRGDGDERGGRECPEDAEDA